MSRWKLSTIAPVVLVVVALAAAWRWGPELGYWLTGNENEGGAFIGCFSIFLLVGVPAASLFLPRLRFAAHAVSGTVACLGFFAPLRGLFALVMWLYVHGSEMLLRVSIIVTVVMAAVLFGVSILLYIRLNRWLVARWSARSGRAMEPRRG